MIEGIVVVITVTAAVVYLVVEGFELKILWRKRRTPEPPREHPPGLGDTWPDERRVEAADEWERAFEEKQP